MPSLAPTVRSHDMKPKPLPRLWPAPASASSVVSVPASGLLIWRTMPACRCCCESQPNTPWSTISFQMAPCPPGFIVSSQAPAISHWPSSADTTGTRGCLQGRGVGVLHVW
jgi:hypothetical protein